MGDSTGPSECACDFGTGFAGRFTGAGPSIDFFFDQTGGYMGIGLFIARSIVAFAPRHALGGRKCDGRRGPSSGCDFRRRRRLVYDARSRAFILCPFAAQFGTSEGGRSKVHRGPRSAGIESRKAANRVLGEYWFAVALKPTNKAFSTAFHRKRRTV